MKRKTIQIYIIEDYNEGVKAVPYKEKSSCTLSCEVGSLKINDIRTFDSRSITVEQLADSIADMLPGVIDKTDRAKALLKKFCEDEGIKHNMDERIADLLI